MFKELKVILSASIQKLKQGIKNAIGVVSGGERKIKQSADKINQSMNNAFGGSARNKVEELNASINRTKQNILNAEKDVKEFKSQLLDIDEGTKEFKALEGKIRNANRTIAGGKKKLKEYNTELRNSKTALAESRLAAEDNQSALESMSRTITAVTGAVLLMDSENESLRNTMKVVNVAFAATNAIVSINNLKLRQNQLFLKASTRAYDILTKAVVGSTRVATLFKAAIGSAVAVGLFYAIESIAKGFNKVSDSLSLTTSDLKDVNDEYAENITTALRLVSIVEDQTIAENERTKALKKLKEEYPEYSKFLGNDINDTQKLTTFKKNLITQLTNEAIVRAAQNKIEEQSKDLTEDFLEATSNTNTILKERDHIQKQLNKTGKEAITNESIRENLENRLVSIGKRLTANDKQKQNALKGINKLNKDLITLQKELNALFVEDDSKATGGDGKSKAAKKSLDQITNLQTKALIAEERIRAEQEKKFLKTEEEKERAAIASEERILAIRKSGLLQGAQAQNLSASQITEALRNLSLQEIKLQNEKSARLQAARDKDTNASLANEKLKYDQTKESLEGSLALEDRITQQSLANLAQAYSDGLIDQETYELAKLELTKEGLIARLKALEAFGANTAAIEQKIADISLKIEKKKNGESKDEAKKSAIDIGNIISRELGKAGRDVADALSSAFQSAFKGASETAQLEIDILKEQQRELQDVLTDSRNSQLQQLEARKKLAQIEAEILEKSQSRMAALQGTMLTAVADFLESLGKGLIAAALAVEAFQKLLATKPLLALGAGVAALAASALVRSRISKGVAFADGGIVSGPTLGLVGEYPGASTNPEVIAPLDKLKNMISGGMNEGGYIAETFIRGRDLALVLSRHEKDRLRG